MLFEPIERENVRAKAQANQLMTAADCQDRNLCRANKVPKPFDDLRPIEIKIAQRAAKNNSVRLQIHLPPRARFAKCVTWVVGILYQPGDVIEDIFHRHFGDHPLALDLCGSGFTPLLVSHI